MSLSLTPQLKKSRSFSKYLYSNIDQTEDFYIFDINLISKKRSKKIKKIKNSKSDILINTSDNLVFNKYNKMNISIVNINRPIDNHLVELNLENKSIIYKDDYVYLEIYSEMGNLKCFYNLEVN
jgi:hypothetical protein